MHWCCCPPLRLVSRGQRRISSKTARAMATWSHYHFKQRLLDKAREHPGCVVVLVNEAYTSKTCGRCGKLHQALGGSKHFLVPLAALVLGAITTGAQHLPTLYE